MFIAFKKKGNSKLDKAISFFTRSEYVHCELVTVKRKDKFFGYSSEPYVGVRGMWVSYNPDEWDFVEIPKVEFKEFFDKTIGKKYDYTGVLGFVFLRLSENPNRWFCSEWCATVLGFDKPHRVSPGKLYNALVSK